MEVVWTAAALRDLAVIREHIAVERPTAANRQVRLIVAAVERLPSFPEMGRSGRVNGTRELVVTRTPYLVAYRLQDDRIEIARVLHGRQRWPDRL
jgi:toxin ParE1/3/4